MKRPDRFFRRLTAREGLPGLIGYILSPAGWLFAGIASARRNWYENRGRRLGVPVLSVGNIEVGGTGKTPVTIWLARRITGMGYRVCVVVRNLGGRRDPCMVTQGASGSSTGFSDEVILLASRLLGRARVYAGRSKLRAAEMAVKERDPDIIIVDDGFQHLKLHRSIDLVVLDFNEPFGRGGVLPAGTLRESPSSLARADHVWINRVRPGMSAEWIRRRVSEYNWKAPVQFSRMRPGGLRLAGSGEPADIPAGSDVLAFCAIGRPESFRETLSESGFVVLGLEVFPDHHKYTVSDLEGLHKIAADLGTGYLVTTGKDAVKLTRMKQSRDVLVLETTLEVEGAVTELLDDVERVIATSKSVRRETGKA